MLQPEDIAFLSEKIAEDFLDNSVEITTRLLAQNELENFLRLIGRNDLITEAIDSREPIIKSKKIAIFGERPNGCSESNLKEAARMVGLEDTSCLEFHLDYKDAKKADFERYRNNSDYCAIFIGAIPHSCKSKGDYGSVLSMLQHEQGFPAVIELRDSTGKLKLSTSTLQVGIANLWSQEVSL
jgi:hypothetical protein